MFKNRISSLKIVLVLICWCFVVMLQAQDSIPEPQTNPTTETPTPPTDITPETPTENTQPEETSSTPTENNSDAYIEAEPYIFEEDLPQPAVVNRPKENPELLAALDGNPFGLIRDGKPKYHRRSLHELPGLSSITSTTKVEKPKEEEKIEEVVQQQQEVFVPVDTSDIALNNLNPFRLEGTIEDRKAIALTKKIKFNPKAGTGAKSTNPTFNPIFDTSKVNVNPLGTLKFVVILMLLGFLTYIITQFRDEVTDVFGGFLNANLLSLLYREKGTILRLPYFLMYVLAACSFGTMAFLAVNLMGESIFKSNFLSILTCISGVGLIFILRHISILFLSYAFPFEKEANLYGFTIAVFNFVIGIGLLPVITFIAFAPTSSHSILLYITLILVGLIYAFRGVRSLIIGNKYLINNKFHFFMYLCTIELAPILILIKLLGF